MTLIHLFIGLSANLHSILISLKLLVLILDLRCNPRDSYTRVSLSQFRGTYIWVSTDSLEFQTEAAMLQDQLHNAFRNFYTSNAWDSDYKGYHVDSWTSYEVHDKKKCDLQGDLLWEIIIELSNSEKSVFTR